MCACHKPGSETRLPYPAERDAARHSSGPISSLVLGSMSGHNVRIVPEISVLWSAAPKEQFGAMVGRPPTVLRDGVPGGVFA